MWLYIILGLWLLCHPKSFFTCAAILIVISLIICGMPLLWTCIKWGIGILIFMGIIGVISSNLGQTTKDNSYTQYKTYNNRQQQTYKQKTSSRYFAGCTTKESLKKRHRELSKKLHPDKGGNMEEFQKMQAEYENLKRHI